MSSSNWGALVPNLGKLYPSPHDKQSRLSDTQAEDLEAIVSASENNGLALGHGISAIGELLAFTADSGNLSDEAAIRIGWLVAALGELSVRLCEAKDDAAFHLQAIARESAK